MSQMSTSIYQAIEKASKISGGMTALAKKIGVSTPTVHQWKTGIRRVPVERCMAIEQITSAKVTAEQLRPDVTWHVIRNANKPSALAHEQPRPPQHP